ncbi:extracellular solute-binding protein [Chloroflexi bacterium TSY]|nr:extracellular solute-binding protein [Chloroflexi bacterium TSY]
MFGEAGYDLLRVPQQNQLSNLTDLWQQANWDETFPTSLKQLSAVDGKQFFLPMVINWVAIYYNIEVFQKYNITPPQTWDEFLLVCDTLQLEGVTPLAFGPVGWTGTYWFDYLNLRLNGADFHRGLLMGQERFDDDRVRNVFEAWRTLFERGCFGENMLSMSSTDSRLSIIHDDDEQLSKQKTAMTLVSSWEKGTLPEKWQNEIDFFRFPFIDPSVPLAELVWSYGYAMPIGVDDVDEAVEFLTYMSSVDTQTILAQGLGPTAIATQPNIDADVLQPSQIKGRDLVNEADDAVIVQLWSLPSAMMMASEQALWLFVHEPENIDAVLLTLEEGRQNALKQGVFQ